MRTIVIHHSNCWDGLVAAWSLGLDPATTTYIEYDHGKPREAEGHFINALVAANATRVIAVDCFPEFIRGAAESVVVIDHHESARERLEDRTGLTEVVFDMTRSAAPLAWLWAHPGSAEYEIPTLVQYVEDRDLWKWELPDSHAVSAYLSTQPMTFETVARVRNEIVSGLVGRIISKGRAILDYQAQVIANAVSRAQVRIIDGVRCAVVNATTLVSETGHALVDGTDTPVALLYRIDGDVLNVSVRTAKDSPIKANDFAARFGGGGHPQAAGFHLPATDVLAVLG